MIESVTEDNLNNFLAKGKVILNFFSKTCPPCKRLAPILVKISDDFTIGKVDVAESPMISLDFSVSAVPTTFIVENGEILHRLNGVHSEKAIRHLMSGEED